MPGPAAAGALDPLLDVTVGEQAGDLLAHGRRRDAQAHFQVLDRGCALTLEDAEHLTRRTACQWGRDHATNLNSHNRFSAKRYPNT